MHELIFILFEIISIFKKEPLCTGQLTLMLKLFYLYFIKIYYYIKKL